MTMLQWLMNWYQQYCDGDWEHAYRIHIDTIDNPGWSVKIGLTDTAEHGKDFSEIRIDNGDDDWIFCYIEDDKFKGYGDSSKLEAILTVFKDWVES